MNPDRLQRAETLRGQVKPIAAAAQAGMNRCGHLPRAWERREKGCKMGDITRKDSGEKRNMSTFTAHKCDECMSAAGEQ